jgi:preprotein translocase subunit SecA
MGEERSDILRKRVPDLYERVCSLIGSEGAVDLERRLKLYAIDQCWADHLAAVAEIRDGIHLVAIGGRSPLEEFQKSVAQSFEQIYHSVDDRIAERFAALQITADGINLEAAGLRGPASTWTYLVQEDVFSDPIAAALVSQRHIGFAVYAALTGPLLMLWMLRRRFQKRSR